MSQGALPPTVMPAPASISRMMSARVAAIEDGAQLCRHGRHAALASWRRRPHFSPTASARSISFGAGRRAPENIQAKPVATARPRRRGADSNRRARARRVATVGGATAPTDGRGRRGLAQPEHAPVVVDDGMGGEARRVARRRARQDRLGAHAARDHRGQDPLGGERLRQAQAVAAQVGAALAVGVDARGGREVRRVEQVVGVPLHRLGLEIGGGLGGDVARLQKMRARRLPGRADLVGIGGPRADVEPVGLGHVPGVAAQIVVQQQLGLAVAADARAGDRGRDRPGTRAPARRPDPSGAAARAGARPGSACHPRRRGGGPAARRPTRSRRRRARCRPPACRGAARPRSCAAGNRRARSRRMNQPRHAMAWSTPW